MTIYNPLTRNTISGRGLQASKGVASSSGAATRGVSSEAEMAAKAPAGANIPNNHIKNPLYDNDNRYPGAGGRVEDWAGYSMIGSSFPTYTNSGTNNITLSFRVTPGGFEGPSNSFRFKVTLQDEAYPNTTKTITKQFSIYSGMSQSSPTALQLNINPSDINGLGVTSQTFNSIIFTLLDGNGFTLPGDRAAIDVFSISFDTPGGIHYLEGWNVFGGAVLTPGSVSGQDYVELKIPNDSSFGHTVPKSCVNGAIGSTWKGNRLPRYWQHYCSLYTSGSEADYDTFFGKRFYRHRKFDNEYKDIAAENEPTTFTIDGYNIGPIQRRIIEIFGSSGRITERADDITRSYPDIPIWGLSRTAIDSSLNITNCDGWVKHSMCQSVKIPDGAASLKYGAYVQVPKTNLPGPISGGGVGLGGSFAGHNFGAIAISQDYGEGEGAVPSGTNERFVRGDYVRFATTNTQTHALPPQDYVATNLDFTQYNWNGLATIHDASATAEDIESGLNETVPTHPHGFRYPTKIVSTGTTKDDWDYREFKLVERTWSNWYSASDLDDTDTHYNTHLKQIPYLQLELIFYEDHANMLSFTPTGAETGAIRFFCPYVQFYDSGGNIITP